MSTKGENHPPRRFNHPCFLGVATSAFCSLLMQAFCFVDYFLGLRHYIIEMAYSRFPSVLGKALFSVIKTFLAQ